MKADVTIPPVGESITEGVLVEWASANGDVVAVDDPLLVLETDKITITVNAEHSGRLETLAAEGDTVQVGQVVATIDTDAASPADGSGRAQDDRPEPAPQPVALAAAAPAPPLNPPTGVPQARTRLAAIEDLPPSVQRMVIEHHLAPSEITGTGKGGRLTKEDVLHHLQQKQAAAAAPRTEPQAPPPAPPPRPTPVVPQRQTRSTMSPLRQRLAERLVQVQQSAAILTTFNEVDMSRVIALRQQFKDTFSKRHDVSLGFMSFFVKACVDALRTFPAVNAYIDGDTVVTNHFYDIGVAVSTEKGLVVPVVRSADQLSMAEIERQIADLARRAAERSLELADLIGAVFTISNGGVFGSMLSTPILNPPGSAILGMHAIEKRPVVVDDEIVIRPMMYLALSYDHRLVDGREAVTFLRRVKDCIEDPERILLEV